MEENAITGYGNNEVNIDFRKIFYRSLQFWFIIPICLILASGLAIYLYKSTTPLYKVSSSILIKGDQRQNASIGSSENALPGISLGVANNIENQLVILTSSKQIEKTLKGLDFTVSYYEIDAFKDRELYKDSPFIVRLNPGDKISYAQYNIKFVDDKRYILTKDNDKKFKDEHSLFENVNLEGNQFVILPNGKHINVHNYIDKKFRFNIVPMHLLVNKYQSQVQISNLHQGSSIYEIALSVNNVDKGKDFVDKLAHNSVEYTLDKKNQIANNTIKFIDSQLIGVGDSLSVAKSMLENFRSKNEMMDVSMQGQLIIGKMQALQDVKNQLQSAIDYYNYLVDYMKSDMDIMNILPPSAYGVVNSMISQLISELGTLNAEREGLQFNSKIDNPNIAQISRKIETLKKTIGQQAESNLKSTKNEMSDADTRLLKLSREVRRLPRTEQVLLDMQRKYQSSDRMYSYLMERRSEALLAKASNTPDNEIIENASVTGKVKPDGKRYIIIVVVLGIFLPSVIMFLIVYFNNKILDKEDVEAKSNYPVVGVIPRVKKDSNMLQSILQPRSALSESIRSIRTTLDFYPNIDGCKSILVTSGMPGEGKSLTASNLAISYAQLGKKTILIDFDMRKPTIHKVFDLKVNGDGLSRHLVESINETNKNLIVETDILNLDIIPAGKVPPNPADLIAGKHTIVLFSELRKLYDVIIIDSPPIGLVTDASLLQIYSEVTLLVTRHGVTPKSMLERLLKDDKIQQMKSLCLLLNGLPIESKAYNTYGYSAKYYN